MPEASTGPTAPAARADEAPRSMAASARIAIAAKLRNRCAAPRFERVLIVSGSPPCRGRGNSSVERRPLEKVSPLRTCREATVLLVRPTSEQRDVATANVLQKKTAAVTRGQAGSRRASWSDHLRRRRFARVAKRQFSRSDQRRSSATPRARMSCKRRRRPSFADRPVLDELRGQTTIVDSAPTARRETAFVYSASRYATRSF